MTVGPASPAPTGVEARPPRRRKGRLSPAGPRAHWVSVVTLAVLGLYLLGIAAILLAAMFYVSPATLGGLLRSREVLYAIRLSAISSICALVLVVIFAVPTGFALSRYRFPGHNFADTIIDLPIVLPPVVMGVALLVFFATPPGRLLQTAGFDPHSIMGIVLCQFLVSSPLAIRAAKVAFDDAGSGLEEVALTLGATHGQAFWRVALPLARNGLLAGAIMAWARGVGLFAPLMVFVGSVRLKTEVMPTTIYLELSVGRLEVALAVTMVMLAMATAALLAIRWLQGAAARRRQS